MNSINFYFLCGYAYLMPFKTKKILDDILVIEEIGLIGTRQDFIAKGNTYLYQRIEIVTPFNYE